MRYVKRRKEKKLFTSSRLRLTMNEGNFIVCANIHDVAGKTARSCSDDYRASFVNDSAVLNEPKFGCYI